MVESISATQYLTGRLDEIKAHQGCLGKLWNGVKELTGAGVSENKCESMLKKFEQGKITFSEALEYIESFEDKQEDMTNLLANVATGVASIAVATTAAAAGPIGWGLAIAKGAPIGALVKTGLKTLDRATNDVKGDALDGKEMLKDAVSGATTGATSAVSSGIGAGIRQGKIGLSVLKGAQCGVVCGAASSAINYTTDSVLDENKDFKFGELTKSAAIGAAVSGSVGAVVGAGIYGLDSLAGNAGKEVVRSTSETIARDSAASSFRKLAADVERNVFINPSSAS